MSTLTLDEGQKLAQIVFYSVATVLAILTYRKARSGLLNTVNTEYQKRVMDRLAQISEKLYEEFDRGSSASYIHKNKGFAEDSIDSLLDEYRYAKSQPGFGKDWEPAGFLVSEDTLNLRRLLDPLESDPFVPRQIRESVVTFLRETLEVMETVYQDELENLAHALANGEVEGVSLQDIRGGTHNAINSQLFKRGCGIEAIESEVHELRQTIQKYFESFYPR